MIQYEETTGLISLSTRTSTYVIGILEDIPICLYWGSSIVGKDLYGFPKMGHHSSFDRNILLERAEYPVWDGRTFTSVSLKADVPLFPKVSGFEIQDERLVISLRDDLSGHCIQLTYNVDVAHDAIIKSATFLCGNAGVHIRVFGSGSFSLPTNTNKYWLHYQTGAWANEFQRRSHLVQEGKFRIESTRGLSGPHFNPAVMLASDSDGAYAALLGWSGSWQMTTEQTIFGNTALQAGWNDADFLAVLAPGETLHSPPLYLFYDSGGTSTLTRKLHDYQRSVLAPKSRVRRVLYNSWEATYFDVHAQRQMLLADRAAQLGVELFVVDDGWFGQRKDDTAGLGDWYVNEEKFPEGLQQLISYVKAKGMAFGLWVEPESVNPDSDLYRAHPDWAYALPGRQPLTLRNQFLLNLGLPQVEEFARNMLVDLLKKHDISYLKWDMNRPFTDVAESITPMAREKHVQAVYRILEHLRKVFPQVDIEACSGGGARVDMGMLARTHQFWPSDNTDPFDRLSIQDGCAIFYPARMTSCWVTDSHPDAYGGGLQELRYRFHVSMSGGSLGIGANIAQYSTEQLELAKEMIGNYRSVRHVILDGDRYSTGDPMFSDYYMVQYVSKDKSDTVAFVFRNALRPRGIGMQMRLQGLSEDMQYASKDGEVHACGKTLMQFGVPIELPNAHSSIMLVFKGSMSQFRTVS